MERQIPSQWEGGGEDFAGEGGGIFLPGVENLRSDFDDPNFFQS